MAKLIHPDGHVETVCPTGSHGFSLAKLHALIGQDLDIRSLSDQGLVMVVGDFSAFNEPYNAAASALYGDAVHGKALFAAYPSEID